MKNTILKDFCKYVSTNIIGTLGISFYILADTYFISNKLGANGLTALNFSIVVFSLIFGFGLMVGMGAAIKFSIANKKSTDEKDDSFTLAVLWWALGSAVALVCAVFFSGSISTILGADETILPLCQVYVKTILFFAPFFIFNNIMLAFVRNDNRPDLAMAAMFISSLSNVVLDYILLYIFEMGMFGAAFATCLSPIISMSIMSIHLIKKKNTFHLYKVKIKLKSMLKICSLGATFFITEVSIGIALFVFNLIILGLQGNIGVAAYGVVANTAIVAVSVFSGISQGTQPLFSAYCAKGELSNVRKIFKYSVFTCLGFAAVIIAITNIFSLQIISVFNEENSETLAILANEGMKLYFIGYSFASLNILISSFLSAVSKPNQGIMISISRSLLVLIPVVFVLSHWFEMSGVWLSFFVSEAIVFAPSIFICVRFFQKNKT